MAVFRFLGRIVGAIWYGLNTLRRVLHLILLLLIFGVLLAALATEQINIPKSAALVVDPYGVLVDQLEGSPLDRAFAELNGEPLPQTLLRDVVDALNRAATDERISAVVLALDGLDGGGLAKLQAIGRAVQTVRAAGKKVIAVGGAYTRDQYFIAAQADEIIMDELGVVYIDGYEYYRTFFRGALDKLSVDLNVFRVGEYKSFVEPFIRDDMSDEDRDASRQWLTALWRDWRRDVAKARKLTPDALDNYANRFAALMEGAQGRASKVAVDARLVDRLMGRPEIDAYLIELAGESESDPGTFSQIDLATYVRAMRLEDRLLKRQDDDVAVIVAAGEIVDGEAAPGTVGGDTLAAELRDARLDDSVAAVVIRIDSPGGSVTASEVIYDEVAALKAAGKPVVASMSSVAASGGYYIAMLADQIWASESTITGSIGVGALIPTIQRGLDRIGVHVDGIGTTALSGQLRLDRELGSDARRIITVGVEDIYRLFIGKVADARKMTVEEVDNVARGRVWIGTDAEERGLVDRIGDIDQAIEAAATLADLAPGRYEVRYLDPDMSLGQRLALEISGAAIRAARWLGIEARPTAPMGGWLKSAVRDVQGEVQRWTRLNDPRGIYLLCACGVR